MSVHATSPTPSPVGAALLAQLRQLQAQVATIHYPNRGDLVGRQLDTIDRALRSLLRELGDRDTVDANNGIES
ncbi:MAG: hypothetical protein IPI03_16265 [Rubrivivax sp.]|nr:hypothetical protein [Rubrivivax sp.]